MITKFIHPIKKCKPNIEKYIEQYCEEHYNQGKAYFKEKKPDKDYNEWKLTAYANPEYKDVKKLLKLVEQFKKK
jgi:hypothetical protein